MLEAGLENFEEGVLDLISPELTVYEQADFLPYDKKWEFPREKLKLGERLGSGEFGVVLKAEATKIIADQHTTIVAVKRTHKNAEFVSIQALVRELKIMVHLGQHLNVVNLLGACTKNIGKRELLVIVEYCEFGNLQSYLCSHRDHFVDQIDQTTGKIDLSVGNNINSMISSNNDSNDEDIIYYAGTNDSIVSTGLNDSHNSSYCNFEGFDINQNSKPIFTQDLISWAFQVARGMEYLFRRKVLHCDLAARNILLAKNNVVKICDFGLSKSIHRDGIYKKQSNEKLPLKWTAIESIRDRVYSTKSDVWSFGIMLWEFFTLADDPYPDMTALEAYQHIIEGYRMKQPPYATKDIYNIMLCCWEADPVLRPSFTDLVESLGKFLEDDIKEYLIKLNHMYENINGIGRLEGHYDYLALMSSPDRIELMSPSHEYVDVPSQAMNSVSANMINDNPRTI
ncbi:vascular endothelial growth factor receptor 1-like [Copidosoma floridanum]|uniref:vascular endothelial growth factor receptor 1-like n=1 Tax=Copidosoma floridanum TaxID=29053 RepID=UPI0006C9AB24|nr:vascular endothelial growth factor receptor 1-like [Copidosoma floridanum]